jgi:hypothetical protein
VPAGHHGGDVNHLLGRRDVQGEEQSAGRGQEQLAEIAVAALLFLLLVVPLAELAALASRPCSPGSPAGRSC